MTGQPPLPPGFPPTLSAEYRINAVCVRFESSLKQGAAITIEDSLEQVPEGERAALLYALVRLEMEYRQRRGETPALAEYAGRFPQYADEIARWSAGQETADRELWR